MSSSTAGAGGMEADVGSHRAAPSPHGQAMEHQSNLHDIVPALAGFQSTSQVSDSVCVSHHETHSAKIKNPHGSALLRWFWIDFPGVGDVSHEFGYRGGNVYSAGSGRNFGTTNYE